MIRDATEDDLRDIVEIFNVAGWLSFQPFMPRSGYRGTAEISVYVHAYFHRHGVARRLLEGAIDRSPGSADFSPDPAHSGA